MQPGSLSGYDPRRFPPVAVTVDVVLFAIEDGVLHVLLIERGVEPFRGAWALPGGFVQPDDRDLEHAAARELAEETGVGPGAAFLEQLATYGAVGRDPRMRVISVAYWAACAEVPTPRGGSDAARSRLVPAAGIEAGDVELAFDHERIVQDGLDRLRAKLEYTAVGARFCGPSFTISELRKVYETVWRTKLDAGNFQRKIRFNGAFREVDSTEIEEIRMEAMAPASPPDPDAMVGEDAVDALYMAGGPLTVRRSARLLASRDLVERRSEPPVDLSPGPRPAFASPGRRGGRPASLWTARDPSAMLNSPIVRPGSDAERRR